MKRSFASLFVLMAAVLVASSSFAEDKPAETVSVAGGKLKLTAPTGWEKKQPRNNIIEAEFSIPAVEGDAMPGRLTLMGAGGSVDANIDRWIGQFAQPDGKATKEVAVIEKKEIGGQTVHLVDISGDYKDQAGPFAPAVERENYRMLAAIIVTKDDGQYFLKLYGPKKTIDANAKAFGEFIASLKKAD